MTEKTSYDSVKLRNTKIINLFENKRKSTASNNKRNDIEIMVIKEEKRESKKDESLELIKGSIPITPSKDIPILPLNINEGSIIEPPDL